MAPGSCGTSSYIVFQGFDSFPLQPIVTGRYADTFACDSDGRWRWTERRYAIDHAGDLAADPRGGGPRAGSP